MPNTAQQQQFPLFEGRKVFEQRKRIVNTGDGLSPAMSSDVELHIGDKAYVLIEVAVARVHFDQEGDDAVRVHTLKALTSCYVDAKFGEPLIGEQREKDQALAEEREAAKKAEREAKREAKKNPLRVVGDDE